MFDVSRIFRKGFSVIEDMVYNKHIKRNRVGRNAPLYLMFIDLVFIVTKECVNFKPTYGVSPTSVVGTIPALESGTRTVL